MRRATALALASLLLAACSGSSAPSATDGSSATTAAPTTGPAPTTTAAATTTTQPPRTYPATIDELLAIGRPIVLAHTAGEDEFPASTLFAFGESVKAGVDMLDLNINITADGELLVQHDDTVDRNTDGTGPVADMTFAEIQQLDGAYWFTEDCGACTDRPDDDYLYRGIRTGEQAPPPGYTADDFALPSLRQLVERFPDIPLNIEIKGSGDIARRTADELAKQLDELGRSEASVVASFDDEVVSYFHSVAPDVEVSPGLNVLTAYVLQRTPIPDGMRILQLPPEYSGLQVITGQLVADTKASGYPIWVWPNDRSLENLDAYRDFLSQGIEGLNINFPAQGVQAVQEFVSAPAAAASDGCSAGAAGSAANVPGEETLGFSIAGLDGTYIRRLPPAYDGTTPRPVVVALHGWSQAAPLLVQQSGLPAFGDDHRFVTVVPDITRPVPLWDTAVDGADVKWVSGLLDELGTTLCIDTSRVFVTGMSNGAMMTSTLSCALADRFAAAAPVAGIRIPDGCNPARPVPVVAFHGDQDQFLAYGGGFGTQVADLPTPDGSGTLGEFLATGPDAVPVPERIATWATNNGCEGEPTASSVADDVDLLDWSGCDVATRFYTVKGGGHTWPGSAFDEALGEILGGTTESISATRVMWRFFLQHTL
jgi:poly(3-hydroxybutyrate) depolymerase/glycerophosphoryl diester phosphodiesterase